jgi:hypothetical protein
MVKKRGNFGKRMQKDNQNADSWVVVGVHIEVTHVIVPRATTIKLPRVETVDVKGVLHIQPCRNQGAEVLIKEPLRKSVLHFPP